MVLLLPKLLFAMLDHIQQSYVQCRKNNKNSSNKIIVSAGGHPIPKT